MPIPIQEKAIRIPTSIQRADLWTGEDATHRLASLDEFVAQRGPIHHRRVPTLAAAASFLQSSRTNKMQLLILVPPSIQTSHSSRDSCAPALLCSLKLHRLLHSEL